MPGIGFALVRILDVGVVVEVTTGDYAAGSKHHAHGSGRA